ncbi:uncharacterized protein LOC131666506 [Phymastichus coffea]|uniref:uncharacterized protein LOC131666506 n=1 Tax=Phymastichus coffea TaxID=108790 RepID=UPI00273B79DD|nr:uncharacterized protein LOC131666506 [Phymastichus coffea]
MFFKIQSFIVILSLLKSCECNELKLKIEDLFVDFINYTYVDEETFSIDIDYETETKSVMNLRLDIIEDLPKDIGFKMKVWGRAFGQYTVPTGINLDVKLCQGKLQAVIKPFMVEAGMSDTCPPNKGTYESHAMSTEIVGLPLSVLPGLHFLVESEAYSADAVLAKVRCYIFVT